VTYIIFNGSRLFTEANTSQSIGRMGYSNPYSLKKHNCTRSELVLILKTPEHSRLACQKSHKKTKTRNIHRQLAL
jgi:hypothetical protein